MVNSEKLSLSLAWVGGGKGQRIPGGGSSRKKGVELRNSGVRKPAVLCRWSGQGVWKDP